VSSSLAPMPLDELEARLTDLATALAFPPAPDLATSIGTRLRAAGPQASAGAAAAGPATETLSRPQPRPRPRARALPWSLHRSARRGLLLAATLALLIVGGALAVRFGLELLSIELGPVPTLGRPSPSPGPAGSPGAAANVGGTLALGRPVTRDQAQAAAPFDVLVPDALGEPDAVYLGGASLRGQVALVYTHRDDLPASGLLGGAGLLVTQNRGEPDDGLAHKLVENGLATIESVVVNGAPGVWISGPPHVFWYLAPDGGFIEDSRRLVGDTLAWERDGVLYRIEGDITLERALEIAESMR
jgi:hypothetical protein